MFYCPVCNEDMVLMTSLCNTCRKIKHYISIYSRNRVMEILDNCLSRTEDKIKNKEKLEIHKEIEARQIKLKNQIKRGTTEN